VRNTCQGEDNQHSWSVDNTGTLDKSNLFTSSSEFEMIQQDISQLYATTVPEEVLQVHGFAPPTKAEGSVCLTYENVNGYCNRMSKNKKVEISKELHEKLEVDNIAAYCKHKLNMKQKKNRNSFNQLFKGGEAAIQSIVEHKVNKNIGRTQQGGTSLLLFGLLTKQLNISVILINYSSSN
jgi:hypothetical protein